MKTRLVAGIVILIAGIIMIFVSNHIKSRVEEGRGQIHEAQGEVDQANSLFSHNAVTSEVGQGVTGSAQRKIHMGEEEAAHYEEVAKWLMIGGIVLIVVGAGTALTGLKKKR